MHISKYQEINEEPLYENFFKVGPIRNETLLHLMLM